MIRNYFVIATRNLLKHKVFSIINVTGLSIGITCCVLLALFIKDEFSYEKHFQGYENIYRVTSTIFSSEREERFQRTSPPVAMTMLTEFPELESATRVVSPPEVVQHLIRFEDKSFYEKTGYLVDSTFFDVFSYAFETGDRNTALDARSTVVLSHELAYKIFSDKNPLDNVLIINSGSSTDTFRVTGVLKPYTRKSQLDADFYLSMNSKGWGEYVMNETQWAGQNFVYSFIKVKPKTSIENLVTKFPPLLDKYGAKDLKELGFKKTMDLQPLKDMHLYSVEQFTSSFGFIDIGSSGNITYVYILGSICIFILLIACINFMNLTTAKASQRAGEVGIRKSLGANRSALIRQFMGESMAIVLLSMVLSLGLVQVVLPLFNQFTQKDISLNLFNAGYVVLSLLGISLITGFLAGSYPAFFLSAFQPARVLKDKHLSGNSSNWLRKGLVVFQFVISITLVSAIIIIQKQMNYIQNKSLGFSPEYKIVLPLRTNEARQAYTNLKTKLKDLAGVKEVSGSSSLPSSQTFRDIPVYADGSTMENAQLHYNVNVDENYFDLLGIQFLAGNDLTYETDTIRFGNLQNNVLVNLASLDVMGLTLENAVGSNLNFDYGGQHIVLRIKGVVNDFHQFSMHRKVAPMIFIIPAYSDYTEMCIALDGASYATTIEAIQNVWNEIVPNTPFENALLTDNVKRQYEADQRVSSIILTFTFIAIFISCLGLYGLSIFIAERKEKEIGIRKVLGASVSGIVTMLSKDFLKLIGIAFILAIPIGYYTMSKWLEGFEYKVQINVFIFLLAGVVSFLIAWITIGIESVKAALGNPVDSLRRE